jgi:NAD(P)H dehydrogenase (quinone)
MKVAITGASGKLGGMVAEALLRQLPAEDVILVSRTPEAVAVGNRAGVQVRQGDFDDAASMREAFTGADRLLLISASAASTGRRVAQHGAAIDAAIEAGVAHVVFTSMPNVRPGHPSGTYAQEYRLTEELLAAAGVGWSTLRNSPYAENLLPRATHAVATGRLTSNAGNGRAAYISRADCAEAAAVALLTAEPVTAYEITGPELLTQAEVAGLLSEVAGRSVELVQLDDGDFVKDLRDQGFPEPRQRSLTAHLVAVREGYFDVWSRSVHQLVGRPPRGLRDVLLSHRAELLPAARDYPPAP